MRHFVLAYFKKWGGDERFINHFALLTIFLCLSAPLFLTACSSDADDYLDTFDTQKAAALLRAKAVADSAQASGGIHIVIDTTWVDTLYVEYNSSDTTVINTNGDVKTGDTSLAAARRI